MSARDLLALAGVGLRTRRLRAALSALGVAVGVASVVAVLGLSASSRADLVARLDALGTNLLRIAPGQTLLGAEAALESWAPRALARLDGVEQVASVRTLSASVRRNDRIPEGETGGLTVAAADPGLVATLGGSMLRGRFLDAATTGRPAVVLGAVAAERLGVTRVGTQVVIGGRRWTVVGILAPLDLAPELDRSALVGFPAARRHLDGERSASTVYVRADPDRVAEVRALLPSAADPENPEEVRVNRPSDALEARAAADDAFTALVLGLGAVALLVGGIGIANMMVVAVVERRPEIGLRRALGATRRHVRLQFLGEALLLGAAGGAGGVLAGAAATAAYAASRGWTTVVPPGAVALGLGAAIAIGALAGAYPAARAARLSPTEALRAV